MFTAAEFRLIRERCPEKLDELLERLNIEKPDWDHADEFEIYTALDDQIVQALCDKMKSDTIINGYVKLLGLGGIDVDYSETDNQLLNQIVLNMTEISNGLGQRIRSSYAAMKAAADPPAPPAPPKNDYSDVRIKFIRPHSRFKVLMQTKVPAELEAKIKEMICDYLLSVEPYNIITDIEVLLKTRNGTYAHEKQLPPPPPPKVEPPPFDYQELGDAIASLKLANDIVKELIG